MNPVKILYDVNKIDNHILENAENQNSVNGYVHAIKEINNIGVDALTLIAR